MIRETFQVVVARLDIVEVDNDEHDDDDGLISVDIICKHIVQPLADNSH